MQKTKYNSRSISNLGAKTLDLLPGEIKLENGIMKNVHASIVRHI